MSDSATSSQPNHDLLRAQQTLTEHPQLTLVLVKGKTVYRFQDSGVRDLLRAMQIYDLRGFAAADKLVGKASALLMVQAEISALFAQTISQNALDLLKIHGLPVTYDKMIAQVLNQKRSGPCPMEQLLTGIDDPTVAFGKLKEKIESVH